MVQILVGLFSKEYGSVVVDVLVAAAGLDILFCLCDQKRVKNVLLESLPSCPIF